MWPPVHQMAQLSLVPQVITNGHHLYYHIALDCPVSVNHLSLKQLAQSLT